jgi:hypothetical protein
MNYGKQQQQLETRLCSQQKKKIIIVRTKGIGMRGTEKITLAN